MGFPMALLKASTQKMLYGVVVSKQIWIMNLLIYDISPDQSYSWKTSQNCLFCKDVFIFNWSPLCPLFVGSRTLQLFILITLFHPFTHQKNSTIISFKWSFSLRIYPSIHPSIHPSVCIYNIFQACFNRTISHSKSFTTATTLPLSWPLKLPQAHRANRWGNPLPGSYEETRFQHLTLHETEGLMANCWQKDDRYVFLVCLFLMDFWARCFFLECLFSIKIVPFASAPDYIFLQCVPGWI